MSEENNITTQINQEDNQTQREARKGGVEPQSQLLESLILMEESLTENKPNSKRTTKKKKRRRERKKKKEESGGGGFNFDFLTGGGEKNQIAKSSYQEDSLNSAGLSSGQNIAKSVIVTPSASNQPAEIKGETDEGRAPSKSRLEVKVANPLAGDQSSRKSSSNNPMSEVGSPDKLRRANANKGGFLSQKQEKNKKNKKKFAGFFQKFRSAGKDIRTASKNFLSGLTQVQIPLIPSPSNQTNKSIDLKSGRGEQQKISSISSQPGNGVGEAKKEEIIESLGAEENDGLQHKQETGGPETAGEGHEDAVKSIIEAFGEGEEGEGLGDVNQNLEEGDVESSSGGGSDVIDEVFDHEVTDSSDIESSFFEDEEFEKDFPEEMFPVREGSSTEEEHNEPENRSTNPKNYKPGTQFKEDLLKTETKTLGKTGIKEGSQGEKTELREDEETSNLQSLEKVLNPQRVPESLNPEPASDSSSDYQDYKTKKQLEEEQKELRLKKIRERVTALRPAYKINSGKVFLLMKQRFGAASISQGYENPNKIGERELKHLTSLVQTPKNLYRKDSSKKKNYFSSPSKKTVLDILKEYETQTNKLMDSYRYSGVPKDYYSALQQGDWKTGEKQFKVSPITLEDVNSISRLISSAGLRGNLTTFCMSRTSGTFFMCGTDLGEILEINLKLSKVRHHKLPNNSSVLSLDLSPDDKIFVAGSEQSHLGIKKTNGGWSTKNFGNYSNKMPIIQAKFVDTTKLIVATPQSVSLLIVADIAIAFEVRETRLYQNALNIVQIEVMPFRLGGLRVNQQVLVISEQDKLSFIALGKNNNFLNTVEKPGYILGDWIPVVSWFQPEGRDVPYCVVFWQNFFLLLKYNDGEFEVVAQKQQAENMLWGTVLGSRIVCVLNEDFEMKMMGLDTIFIEFQDAGGFGGTLKIQEDKLLQARGVCVRKDGKITRSFQGRILKQGGHSIGVLTRTGIMKIRLMSLKDLAKKHVEEGKWLRAFKLCVDVVTGVISSSELERVSIQEEAVRLTYRYIENFGAQSPNNDKEPFFDKSGPLSDLRSEEMQGRVARVGIEVLIETQNVDKVFEETPARFKSKVFWGQIDYFIQMGKLVSVPIPSLVQGAKHLSSKSLQRLFVGMDPRKIEECEMGDYCSLVNILKTRKLWVSLYKLAFMRHSDGLGDLLDAILSEMVVLDSSVRLRIPEHLDRETITKMVKKSLIEPKTKQDAELATFLRGYWIIWKIFNWKNFDLLVPHLDGSSEFKEDIWVETFRWLSAGMNSKVLGTNFIQLYLEIFYEIFLNHDLISCWEVEKRLRVVWREVRAKKIEDTEIESQWILVEDADPSLGKLIFLLIETVLDARNRVDVAFLLVKILNLSMYDRLYLDSKMIKAYLKEIIAVPLRRNRFWMFYKPLNEVDVQDHIVRVLKKLKFIRGELSVLRDLAQSSGQNIVFARIIDTLEGRMNSLGIHIDNMKALGDQAGKEMYIFKWLSDQLDEAKLNKRHMVHFCHEISQYLPELIELNRDKTRDIIIKFPNIGEDAIQMFDCYPDLQKNYIKKLLDLEKVDVREHKVDDVLKLRYLELICLSHKDKLIEVIQENTFPMEKALDICYKNNHDHGVAFVTYKLGLIQDALEKYCKIIKNCFIGVLEDTENSQLLSGKTLILLSDAQFAFEISLNICVEAAKESNLGAKKIFESLIHFAVKLYLTLYKKVIRTGRRVDYQVCAKVLELMEYIRDSLIEKSLINYTKFVGTHAMQSMLEYDYHFRFLNFEEYKGLLEFLTFELEMMRDVKALQKSDDQDARLRSRRINMEITSYAMLLSSPYPVELNAIKSTCEYPKDFMCPKTPLNTNISRKVLATINRVEQEKIADIAQRVIDQEVEVTEKYIPILERRFMNADLIDENDNDERTLCFDQLAETIEFDDGDDEWQKKQILDFFNY